MRRILIGLIGLVLVACNPAKQEEKGKTVHVKGRVGFPIEGRITIKQIRPVEENAWQDTIVLKKDYSFDKVVAVQEPGFYQINFYDKQFVTCILDESDVEITVDGNSPQGFSEVRGSRDSELVKKYQYLLAEAQHSPALAKLQEQFDLAVQKGEEKTIASLQQAYMDSLTRTKDRMASLLLKEDASLGLIDYILNGQEVDLDKHFEVLDDAIQKAEKKWPGNFYVVEYKKVVDNMRKTAIGQIAPEISLPDPTGATRTLSSFRGKYILVDFWAKWCGPCRRENPNVVKAYHAFKNKGFDIFGVSLDRDKGEWVRAIEEDGLVWTQVSDLQYFNSKAAQDYNITGIPFSLLLDPEGKIIAKNLRGEALHRKLAEVLK